MEDKLYHKEIQHIVISNNHAGPVSRERIKTWRNSVRFCSYLVRDINFEPDAVQPCCNTRALRRLPRFPFSGGPLDMKAYRRHIAACLEELQGGGDMCRGCQELREPDIQVLSSLPAVLFRTVSVNMHRHLCNCRCVYCELWKKPAVGYEILPAVKSLWRQGVLHSACFFSWGGGEPGILREFEDACAWIRNRGFRQYVHTNALRRSGAVVSLLEAGAGGVNISIDSASPEMYKAVKGIDGFARVASTVRDYVEHAADKNAVTLKYIIFPINNSAEEIEKFFDFCRREGVGDVQFSFDFREVNAGALSEETLRAAVLFVRLAVSSGIRCSPFFVDDGILGAMAEISHTM
jgi:pyruvate-formate lyase-activating enzyme